MRSLVCASMKSPGGTLGAPRITSHDSAHDRGTNVGASTRIFIDFWNFSLHWNERASKRCDWLKLPNELLREAASLLRQVGSMEPLDLEETIVHASVKASPSEARLKQWLTGFLDHQPSFRVKIRQRGTRPGGIWCNNCKQQIAHCPNCDTEFERAPEKGVDAALVTDLLTLASADKFSLAILVTADADLIPAVEWIQDRGLKVVNATWSGHGYELAGTCWASFHLDKLIPALERSDSP